MVLEAQPMISDLVIKDERPLHYIGSRVAFDIALPIMALLLLHRAIDAMADRATKAGFAAAVGGACCMCSICMYCILYMPVLEAEYVVLHPLSNALKSCEVVPLLFNCAS